MLSYIYRIVRKFEKSHHYLPNILYLNKEHFHHLRYAFADPDDIDEITRKLAMHIIISHDAIHPHLARIEKCWGHAEQLPAINIRATAVKKESFSEKKKGLKNS